jgi:aspartate aminotransferase/aromatic-amino-acid transaminase
MQNFLNDASHGKKMIDKVFKAAVAAKTDELTYKDQVVNATLGTLYAEDGSFVAFDQVWNTFDQIDKVQKAKYASGIDGNPDYKQSVKNWLKISDFEAEVIATPGGAGAVSATLKNTLNPGEIVLKPSLGWGPYKTMAEEFGIIHQDYRLFDGDHFDVTGLLKDAKDVLTQQGKAVVIVNDPCHNPSGYTMTSEEWDVLLQGFEELSSMGKIILLHDIAYIDFNHQLDDWKSHFKRYDSLHENIMVVVAFSTSKTLTAYGARAGAAVVFTKDPKERQLYVDAMIYSARSIWSTVNNSAMKLFSTIESTPSIKEAYIKEKQYYIDLLKERADIFLKEAREVNLPIYPFKEGFFITIKVDDDKIEEYNQRLQENHIFTVSVAHGLRVAICSVSKKQIQGLAKKIHTTLFQ